MLLYISCVLQSGHVLSFHVYMVYKGVFIFACYVCCIYFACLMFVLRDLYTEGVNSVSIIVCVFLCTLA